MYMYQRKSVQMLMAHILDALFLIFFCKLIQIWFPRKSLMYMYPGSMGSRFTRKKDQNITQMSKVHNTSLIMENTTPMDLIRITQDPMPLKKKNDNPKLTNSKSHQDNYFSCLFSSVFLERGFKTFTFNSLALRTTCSIFLVLKLAAISAA